MSCKWSVLTPRVQFARERLALVESMFACFPSTLSPMDASDTRPSRSFMRIYLVRSISPVSVDSRVNKWRCRRSVTVQLVPDGIWLLVRQTCRRAGGPKIDRPCLEIWTAVTGPPAKLRCASLSPPSHPAATLVPPRPTAPGHTPVCARRCTDTPPVCRACRFQPTTWPDIARTDP